jgi:hypothetical protein
MVRQPLPYTGWRESMVELGRRENIMHTRVNRTTEPSFRVTEFYNGLFTRETLSDVVNG